MKATSILATCCALCGLLLFAANAGAQTTINAGAITNFTGPGGLDLSGNFPYAVNLFGSANQSINGVTFTSDLNSIPGYSFSIPNQIDNWGTKPNYGASPDEVALADVMHDIRWANAPLTAKVDLAVVPGTNYKLQLMWAPNGDAVNLRQWDIRVEGQDLVDEVTSYGVFQAGKIPLQPGDFNVGTLYTYSFTANDNVASIEMGNLFGNSFGGDRNAIWQALTLEELPTVGLTWNGAGDGPWNSATQWTGGAAGDTPNATRNALIVGNTVTASGANTGRAVTINSGGLSVPGTLSLAASATVNGGSLNVAGSMTTVGDLNTASGTSLQLTGALQSQSIGIGGSASFGAASTTTANSLKINSGTTTIATGATFNTPTLENAGGTVNAGALNVNGAIKNSAGSLTATGQLTATSLTVSGGSVSTAGANLASDLAISGGSFSSTADVSVNSVGVNGGTVNLNGHNLIVRGSLQTGDSRLSISPGNTFTAQGSNLSSKADSVVLSGGTVTLTQTPALPSVAGLQLRLDANRLVGAEGTPVSTWQDLSGNGNHASQALSTAVPSLAKNGINGLPTVRFDGNDYIATSASFNTPYTIFSVTKMEGSQNQRLVTSGSLNWLLGDWGGKEDLMYAEGWISPDGNGPGATTTPHIYSATGNGAGTTTLYSAGTVLFSNGNGNSGIGTLSLGGWLGGGQESSKGDVSEVLIYNGVLSPAEMNSVGYYLSSKYAIPSTYTGTPGQIDLGTTNFTVASSSTLSLAGPAQLGNISLANGATLTIAGTTGTITTQNISGNATINASSLAVFGALSPGNSPGTLSVSGNLSMLPNASLEWELGAGASDLVSVGGNLALSTWRLVLHDAGGHAQPSDQFTLFNYAGSLVNGIGAFTIDSSQVNPARWNTAGATIQSSNGRVYLTGISVVPEPSTCVLGLIGFVALPLLRRRWAKR